MTKPDRKQDAADKQSPHLVGDYGETPPGGKRREGLPTGEKTGGTSDVADPHPSQEEGYDRKSKIPPTGL